MRRGLLVLAVALPAATLAADTAAAARRGPCMEGAKRPRCVFQDARAVFVADGDTIRVRLAGRIRTVRFTGINAMELTRYSKYPSRRRGACHGFEATALVERAVKRSRWKVRLGAQRLSSRASRRLRRSVWVRRGGRWRDLSKLELKAGLALWLPNHIENAHNREYAVLARRARPAPRRLVGARLVAAPRPRPRARLPLPRLDGRAGGRHAAPARRLRRRRSARAALVPEGVRV